MKLNFIWKENKRQYETGETLYLNRIRVAEYSWNVSRPRGTHNDDNWGGLVDLPSLTSNSKRAYSDDTEKIKKQIEGIITGWFSEALEGGK